MDGCGNPDRGWVRVSNDWPCARITMGFPACFPALVSKFYKRIPVKSQRQCHQISCLLQTARTMAPAPVATFPQAYAPFRPMIRTSSNMSRKPKPRLACKKKISVCESHHFPKSSAPSATASAYCHARGLVSTYPYRQVVTFSKLPLPTFKRTQMLISKWRTLVGPIVVYAFRPSTPTCSFLLTFFDLWLTLSQCDISATCNGNRKFVKYHFYSNWWE